MKISPAYEFSLSELLADIVEVDQQSERKIFGICTDSRKVKKGDLFIACNGSQFDARNYINQAIAQGAVAIVYEADNKKTSDFLTMPIFAVNNLPKYIGLIAARFYHNPSANMAVIGVTGTNGKTSCSQFIARCLQFANISCGVIGTLGTGFLNHLKLGINTTPDPITLQHELAELKQQGANAIAMEVTSHSLVQDRVQGVNFDIAVFTNLTRDHLDYHGTMENYANAKRLLFEKPGLRYAVINLDDSYGREYLKHLPKNLNIYGYSIANASAAIPVISAHDIKVTPKGFSARVQTPWGNGELRSQLLGRFNLSNLLAVLTVLNLMHISLQNALDYIFQLETVPGRMQVLGGDKQALVVVDYAHTPDALEKVLTALREHCQGKLYCVFGCGGERDRGKRPIMAKIAEDLSDHVIITDDNPRREDSEKIIADIIAGLKNPKAAEIIPDRRAAIAQVIGLAKKTDIVLIAGKGHENYQIIGTEKLPFDDVAEVAKQLAKIF